MSQHEAVCEQHKAVNGRHYLSFAVDGPGDAPDEFEYEDGWAVDWDAVESASND